MRFEWDEAKNRANHRKHGLDFADARQVFDNPLFVEPDTREPYTEERFIGLGTLHARVVVIAFAERGEQTIRVISLRKANKREQKQYAKAIQNGLGSR